MSKERERSTFEKTAKAVEYGGIVVAVLGLIGGLADLALVGAGAVAGAEFALWYKRKKEKKVV